MSDPVTLGDMLTFLVAQRPPFRAYGETFYYGLREACDRAITAGQVLTTPIASVDRLPGLYARFVAVQAQ